VRQVNLDLHYRAVAGLGKKTIQKNQEEFVNRAWKQVELVQALNRALYQKLLSIKVNASVRGLK
jgi:predicted methyltransferase MtxX (methanogen marker protein 4)